MLSKELERRLELAKKAWNEVLNVDSNLLFIKNCEYFEYEDVVDQKIKLESSRLDYLDKKRDLISILCVMDESEIENIDEVERHCGFKLKDFEVTKQELINIYTGFISDFENSILERSNKLETVKLKIASKTAIERMTKQKNELNDYEQKIVINLREKLRDMVSDLSWREEMSAIPVQRTCVDYYRDKGKEFLQ